MIRYNSILTSGPCDLDLKFPGYKTDLAKAQSSKRDTSCGDETIAFIACISRSETVPSGAELGKGVGVSTEAE